MGTRTDAAVSPCDPLQSAPARRSRRTSPRLRSSRRSLADCPRSSLSSSTPSSCTSAHSSTRRRQTRRTRCLSASLGSHLDEVGRPPATFLSDSCKTDRSFLFAAILRPDQDTTLTIEDRAPALFVADLVRHYKAVFPAVIMTRRQEVERLAIQRKSTRPVDKRMSRSSSAFITLLPWS